MMSGKHLHEFLRGKSTRERVARLQRLKLGESHHSTAVDAGPLLGRAAGCKTQALRLRKLANTIVDEATCFPD